MQLKKCPFCGSKADLQSLGTYQPDHQVFCKNADCICNEYSMWWDTWEEAVEAWNRRTPSGS